jgi:hypothetical protein
MSDQSVTASLAAEPDVDFNFVILYMNVMGNIASRSILDQWIHSCLKQYIFPGCIELGHIITKG